MTAGYASIVPKMFATPPFETVKNVGRFRRP